MEAIHGDKLRGHLETMVLSTLEQGEAHGLEILRRLEEAGCGLLRLKEGSLYPALYRLEAAGAVKAVWESEPHGRRGARRRIYGPTAAGSSGGNSSASSGAFWGHRHERVHPDRAEGDRRARRPARPG